MKIDECSLWRISPPVTTDGVSPMVYLCSGVNVFVRKIAVAAASSPAVEIIQEGESLHIQTSTSVRTTQVSFTVGQSFNETTVDGRPCTVPNNTTFWSVFEELKGFCVSRTCIEKYNQLSIL